MARIKVTGYIESDDLPYGYVDLGHEMGITDEAYTAWSSGEESLPRMDDLDFKVES